MTSYSSSSSWTCRLRCSSSSQSGAFLVSAATWSVITGTIAMTNSASAATTMHDDRDAPTRLRRSPRRMKHSTSGLSPTARNSDTTIRISTELIARICWPSQIASRAPAAPKKPM